MHTLLFRDFVRHHLLVYAQPTKLVTPQLLAIILVRGSCLCRERGNGGGREREEREKRERREREGEGGREGGIETSGLQHSVATRTHTHTNTSLRTHLHVCFMLLELSGIRGIIDFKFEDLKLRVVCMLGSAPA
jgi:hypothetical protein